MIYIRLHQAGKKLKMKLVGCRLEYAGCKQEKLGNFARIAKFSLCIEISLHSEISLYSEISSSCFCVQMTSF